MTRKNRWWNIFRHKRDKPLRAMLSRLGKHKYMKFEKRTRMIFRARKMQQRKVVMV